MQLEKLEQPIPLDDDAADDSFQIESLKFDELNTQSCFIGLVFKDDKYSDTNLLEEEDDHHQI